MTTYANPGAIANVITLTGRVESTWGQAIRDRVVNNFANAAARDAAIPSPVVGQTCYIPYLIGNPLTGHLIYQGAVTGWTPPWNTSWGVMGTPVSINSDQGSITTVVDVASATQTWTAIAGRLYEVKVSVVYSNGAISANQINVTDAANTIIRRGDVRMETATGVQHFQMAYNETGLTAGSKTRKLRALATAGTLTIKGATSDTQMSVKDIGPTAVPL